MPKPIFTTHVGSLPRPVDVSETLFAAERGDPVDEASFALAKADAVATIVRLQVEAGIDLVSDGEMSKISYATYIKDRITGFEGDSPRRAPAHPAALPSLLEPPEAGGRQ